MMRGMPTNPPWRWIRPIQPRSPIWDPCGSLWGQRRALTDFRRILARDPANAPARRKEAQALIALKRLDEARAVLEALLATGSADRKAIELIAQACGRHER